MLSLSWTFGKRAFILPVLVPGGRSPTMPLTTASFLQAADTEQGKYFTPPLILVYQIGEK